MCEKEIQLIAIICLFDFVCGTQNLVSSFDFQEGHLDNPVQYSCEAQGPLRNLKVEVLVDERKPNKGRCHSVIAKPGTPNGGGQQVHREFVLFNGARAYPEMIVYFETSSDP